MYKYVIKPSTLSYLQDHESLDFCWKLCSCSWIHIGKAMAFMYRNTNHAIPAITGQTLQIAFWSWTLPIQNVKIYNFYFVCVYAIFVSVSFNIDKAKWHIKDKGW